MNQQHQPESKLPTPNRRPTAARRPTMARPAAVNKPEPAIAEGTDMDMALSSAAPVAEDAVTPRSDAARPAFTEAAKPSTTVPVRAADPATKPMKPAAAPQKQPKAAVGQPVKKKQRASRKKTVVRVILRTLLVLFTLIALLAAGLCMVMNEAFNGPSETACTVLTMSMLESSGMKWVPALFIGEEKVEEIRSKNENAAVLPDDQSDPTQIVIEWNTVSGGNDDFWKNYPDGIRIEDISGDTYNAHVMLIRDPSRVYLATSNARFSTSIPGTRINQQIQTEGAVAAINGGAFFDNGTSSPVVGSVPCGLTVSKGKVVWDDHDSYNLGFAGFTRQNVLVVAKTMTANQVKELDIRDGCTFGPVLIMNGTVNEEAYNTNSGYNPRTAIGQRADGSVIFLCIDGRQAGSLGGTYADTIDILVEYGAVNACNLDGGSSSVMLYKDAQGRYGEKNEIVMINKYSLLQEEPRKMPTFFMVASDGK